MIGRQRLLALAAGAVLVAVSLAPSEAGASAVSFAFTARADTYVSSSTPTTAYGSTTSMKADSSPVETAFLRFDLTGIGGRQVVGARLRLLQKDSSPLGGEVHSISSTSWTEGTTHATKPAIDGPLLGSFGSVGPDTFYELDVTAGVVGDGPVSLAIVGPSSNNSVWFTREAKTGRPQLIVEVMADGLVLDGISEVADETSGSSDPTYFSTNHRMGLTAAGRLLAVYGRHRQGVQLAWRDPGGGWRTSTSGDKTEGLLLGGTTTGDWPSSIAVGRDTEGVEHAWVVWAGADFYTPRPVQLRRLSSLDAPGGPTVGPLVTLEASPLGATRADIQLETAADGTSRATLVWTRRAAETAYELVTAWIQDLSTDTPVLSEQTVHFSTTSSSRGATLAATPAGMRALVRSASGRLVQLAHDATAPLSTWTTGAAGPSIVSNPVAGTLADGTVVTVAETDATNKVVAVHRVSPSGAAGPVELSAAGLVQPTLATDGDRVWLIAVRAVDKAVVSRVFEPGTGWSIDDRVEVGSEAGGNAAYPNTVRQTDGRLRILVRGSAGGTSQNAVLAVQRPTD